jgi:hypothetical protein
MDRRLLPFVATAVVVAVAMAWFVRQTPAPEKAVTQAPAAAATGTAVPAATASRTTPDARTANASASPTPTPTKATMLRNMESRFVADPLAPEWAQRNEKAVADFLAAPNLTGLNLAVPLQQRVECRSTMCRVALLFADIDAATQVHERMVLSIGQALPMARTFTVTHDDGRIELIMFAGDEGALAK